MKRKWIREQLESLLEYEGVCLNEEECDMESVIDYIMLCNENEIYSIDDWYEDTKANYPKCFRNYYLKEVLEMNKHVNYYDVIEVLDEKANSVFPQDLRNDDGEIFVGIGIEYLMANEELMNAQIIDYANDFGEIYMQVDLGKGRE